MVRSLMGAVLATAALSATAWAQGSNKGDIDVTKSLWNAEDMMSKACDGISARYNLDERQKSETCKMLTERVTKFLNKHDKELWPLLAELMPFQLAGEQPDVDLAKSIADRGYHIFEDARKEILRSQDDFRKLLNDDQVRIHDRDLRGLHNQLNGIDRSFANWKEGQVGRGSPLEQVRFAGNQRLVHKPTKTARGRLHTYEGQWERYVKDFIRLYNLDDGQKNRANSILNDLKLQAAQYGRQNKEAFAEAERTVSDARAVRPVDMKKILDAEKLRDLLYEPYDDWFAQLKKRLEQIPTEKQRQSYAEMQKGRTPARSMTETGENARRDAKVNKAKDKPAEKAKQPEPDSKKDSKPPKNPE